MKRVALIAVVAGCVLLATGPAYSQPRPASHVRAATTAPQWFQTQQRARFGFDESRASLTAAAKFDNEDNMLGIPLSESELSRLARLQAMQDSVGAVRDRLASRAGYEGIWADNGGNGALHIQVSDARLTKNSIADAERLLPHGVSVEVDELSRSLQSLNELVRHISTQIGQWSAAGVSITRLSVNQPEDLVDVTLSPASPMTAESQLRTAYGPSIGIHRALGARPDSARDIRTGALSGGEWINDGGVGDPAGTYELCSAGYGNNVDPNGNVFEVTAGHCQTNLHAPMFQGLGVGENQFGTNRDNKSSRVGGHTTCDCMAVGPLPAGKNTRSVLGTGNKLNYMTELDEPYVGEFVCNSGARTFDKTDRHQVCGHVVEVGGTATITGDGISEVLDDDIVTDFPTMPGDSGSVLFDGSRLLGILAGSNSSSAFFSKATNFPHVNVRPVF